MSFFCFFLHMHNMSSETPSTIAWKAFSIRAVLWFAAPFLWRRLGAYDLFPLFDSIYFISFFIFRRPRLREKVTRSLDVGVALVAGWECIAWTRMGDL